MSAPGRFTALVLAGSRSGTQDPVARAAGVAHKSLVEIAGRAMLMRVLDSVRSAPSVGHIVLAIEDRDVIDALPELAAAVAAGTISIVPTSGSPAATVHAGLQALATPYPMLVTTSDHALLDRDMIEFFCAALPPGLDAAVALCARRTIEGAYPGSRRSYIRLGGEGYSGCNLFALMTARAADAVAFWTRMEAHRKTPWKYALEIGIWPLFLYAAGRLTLAGAFERLSRIIGVRGAPVLMPMAEAAIDVDTPADLQQVRAIAERRAANP